jgi:hypothetical protein
MQYAAAVQAKIGYREGEGGRDARGCLRVFTSTNSMPRPPEVSPYRKRHVYPLRWVAEKYLVYARKFPVFCQD